MSVSKGKAYLNYKEEIFKQTMPYPYEMTYLVGDRCEATGDAASAKVIYFPNEEGNVLNFEGINEEYIIFVSREGITEKNFEKILISLGRGADIIYCDEDFTIDVNADISDINVRVSTLRTPYRKPDYSPDTIVSFPYIETCFAIRTTFARTVPALKKTAEISDNIRCCDFLLRALERTTSIAHVPYILYHRDLRSLCPEMDAEKVTDEDIFDALYAKYQKNDYRLLSEAAISRRGYNEYPEFNDEAPLVSIIIPSKDHVEILKECIRNIRKNAGEVPYEIIVVDNGSDDTNKAYLEKYISELPKDRGTYLYDKYDFNFSYMCNLGAKEAKGDYLLFLNDDVTAVTDDFLKKLLRYAYHNHVGAVGAKLLYPDNKTIQHIGVFDTNRGPVHKLISKSDERCLYYLRNRYCWNVLGVTAACLMVDREKYFQVGGFNDKMKVGYNDIDLCVKLIEAGYYNLVNNECVLIHHESLSRGEDASSDEKSQRLHEERNLFYELHPWLAAHTDPFYGYMLDKDTIEINSVVVPDYQKADYRNKVYKHKKLPAKTGDKVSFSIDYCGIERGIAKDVEDAYVIEGWGLTQSGDNSGYEKYLVLVALDDDGKQTDEVITVSTCPKHRNDVIQVFPNADNIMLAGFTCRIPFSQLDAGTRYAIGVMVKKPSGFRKYKVTLGDKIYEPRRGIEQDS